MENAADALKMAGAVLIFVLAISIAILSFGKVRETADIILDYKDRETMYIDGNLYYETTGTERQVGLETVLPTILRAYDENYKVVFVDSNGDPFTIYTKKLNDNTEIKVNKIDSETNQYSANINVVAGDENDKFEFLCGILYHRFKTTEQAFMNKFGVILNDKSLYEELNNQNIVIKEYLGVYYQDDSDIPEVNKTEKRIITYEITR